MRAQRFEQMLKKTPQDKVFETDGDVSDFKFNEEVADVFDDMVSRSVPFYEEMQRMTCELAADFVTSESNIYDIGCATGTTLLRIDAAIREPGVTLVGIDNSEDMLDKARRKLEEAEMACAFDLKLCDLHKGLEAKNASVITMLLTLQFIRPLYRERIVQRIYDGLNADGCLIMIEKVTSEDTLFNRLFIQHYYEFKRRNGYSETEIANKREALENVLIPYRMDENMQLLHRVGFSQIEVFFRWYNFCGMIAVK